MGRFLLLVLDGAAFVDRFLDQSNSSILWNSVSLRQRYLSFTEVFRTINLLMGLATFKFQLLMHKLLFVTSEI